MQFSQLLYSLALVSSAALVSASPLPGSTTLSDADKAAPANDATSGAAIGACETAVAAEQVACIGGCNKDAACKTAW